MMAAEENHHACKRSRVGNCVIGPVAEAGDGGLRQWYHPSSRIFRVSRASGGKDRHSKVYTAKGLRDRRVRLSVSTAIQFYDLQDRLGFDQPSKAIEWLIKAASSSIAELPTLESSFPESLNLHEEKPEMERELDLGQQQQQQQQQQQHLSLTKSGCSSNSETSKGSVLSLSRPNNRLKARERARERAAKDKEKEELEAAHHQNVNNHQSSFTELLTGGNGAPIAENPNADCVRKQIRYLPITAGADYFTQVGLFGEPHQASSGFSSQSHIGMVPLSTGGDHPEMQQFSFLQDHPVAVATMAGDYNLNFSISSGLSGFNRGTLQSNSSSQLPHHHHHLHRLSSPADRSSLPFFFGGAAPLSSVSASAESQLPASFDGRLQLCYSDDYSHSDMKGKGKS